MVRLCACLAAAAVMFSSPSVQGGELNVEALLEDKGTKLVAVEFYASWCQPCVAAIPRWRQLHEAYRSQGLRLVVVATQDAPACERGGLPWSPDLVVCDDDGKIAARFGAQKLPAAYLWSWQGRLLASHAKVDTVARRIDSWLKRASRVLVEAGTIRTGASVDAEELVALVRDRLKSADKLVVVATDAERRALREVLKRSLSSTADETLACEIGAEVPANALLKASIGGRKKRQRLYLQLLSAEKGCLIASSTAPWNVSRASASVAQGVRGLLTRLKTSPPQSPAPSARRAKTDAYDELARQAEASQARANKPARRASKLDKAWKAVAKVAHTPTLSRRKRIGAVRRFLRDFGSKNRYAPLAKSYLAALRARRPLSGAVEMVPVPRGAFMMGCDPSTDDECREDGKAPRKVKVGHFSIDKTEVTVAAYAGCVKAGACKRSTFKAAEEDKLCNWGRRDRADHPMNCVSWAGAKAYCRFQRKRLPSEAQWEKAARGTDGRRFPWGNEPMPSCSHVVMDDGQTGNDDGETSGCGRGTTWPVGSKPAGRSPWGALDMVGNVWEWTADWHERGKSRALRGGSWVFDRDTPRVSYRRGMNPALGYAHVGFRCVRRGR